MGEAYGVNTPYRDISNRAKYTPVNRGSKGRREAALCCRAAPSPVAALFFYPAPDRSFAIARRRSSSWKGLFKSASTGLLESPSRSA